MGDWLFSVSFGLRLQKIFDFIDKNLIQKRITLIPRISPKTIHPGSPMYLFVVYFVFAFLGGSIRI